MNGNKLKVGVIGATGMVGQRFLTLLENHPEFCLRAAGVPADNPALRPDFRLLRRDHEGQCDYCGPGHQHDVHRRGRLYPGYDEVLQHHHPRVRCKRPEAQHSHHPYTFLDQRTLHALYDTPQGCIKGQACLHAYTKQIQHLRQLLRNQLLPFLCHNPQHNPFTMFIQNKQSPCQ